MSLQLTVARPSAAGLVSPGRVATRSGFEPFEEGVRKLAKARMNSRQRQRHRDTERQADAKINPIMNNAGYRC